MADTCTGAVHKVPEGGVSCPCGRVIRVVSVDDGDASGPRVAGLCPMGCGPTLFVGDGGHITCSLFSCPRPSAIDELLEDGEPEHLVRLDEDTFTVRHPLRERLDNALMSCDLHELIAGLDGPPRKTGTYRVTLRPGSPWSWSRCDG